VAKTNIDQFATGLVGTRSPLGVPRNPLNATLVPGGSSSGSAVAVASGAVSIALGTDTAGSGRVPAALCGIVGFKPTCGWISTRGVLPAMRRFDCVSVFANNVTDAYRVVEAAAGFDALDPASRRAPVVATRPVRVIGVPDALPAGVCDNETERVMGELPAWLTSFGFEIVRVPIDRLLAWGQLLYGSALVAERQEGFGHLIDGAPDANEVVRSIVDRARLFTAMDAYEVERELAIGRRYAEQLFTEIDALVLPTTPGVATLEEVAADPIGKNAWLGTFTTFVNPLDLAAVAIPHQQRNDGLPFGVQLIGPAWSDRALADAAATMLGETAMAPPALSVPSSVDVVVFGAHLRGQPLNGQLQAVNARFVSDVWTAPAYRCFAIPGKPALFRSSEGGVSMAGELWSMDAAAFGALTRVVPHPLAIGNVELDDGRWVKGFVAEPVAMDGAHEITEFGSWRAYLAST
jgi:allophanate hydrolase